MAAIFQNGRDIHPRSFLAVSMQWSFMGKSLYGLKDDLISFPNIDLASSNTPLKSSYSPKCDRGVP